MIMVNPRAKRGKQETGPMTIQHQQDVEGLLDAGMNLDEAESTVTTAERILAKRKAKREPLQVRDIQLAYDNDDWLGHGYLGERERPAATRPEVVQWADAAVLRVANAKHWSPERFFDWLNSKRGRWYADEVFHTDAVDFDAAAERYVR